MSAPATIPDFLGVLRRSEIIPAERLDALLRRGGAKLAQLGEPARAADVLLKAGQLSHFQARHLLQGHARGFWIKRYLVLEELGAGGMGRVYLCEQTPMDRLVAVKVLPANTPPGSLERFLREAKASAALDHPNIVRAFDVDHDDRFHFLVMEFVDGPTLQRLVDKHGPLPVDRACHYATQAAVGLHHAHQAGWIHRDIKPGNLLVDRAGTVKVLDLGLARVAVGGDDLTKKFDDNNLLGTADYIAPELTLQGSKVDARADLYSLGATLIFLLTGRPPFGEANLLQKLMAHQVKDAPALDETRPGVPKALAALVSRMMAKNPAQRPASAAEVAEALTPFAGEGSFPPRDGELASYCPRVWRLLQATPKSAPPRSKPARPAAAEPPAETAAETAAEHAAPRPAKKRPARPAPRRRVAVLGAALASSAAVLGLCGCGLGWWGYRALRGDAAAGPGSGSARVSPDQPAPAAQPSLITPEQASHHIDERCTIQFIVRSAALSKNQKTLFLNSDANYKADTNFTVVVHGVDSRPDVGALPEQYRGKTIRITGIVIRFEGRPEIVTSDLGHVQVVAP